MSRLIPGLLVLILVTGNAVAERLYCHRCASAFLAATAPDSPVFRKYARDRKIDVEHLRLEVTPDYERHTVSGIATIRFKPIGLPLREVAFDGVDLTVNSVRASARLQEHQVTADQVICTFRDPVPVGQSPILRNRRRGFISARQGMVTRPARSRSGRRVNRMRRAIGFPSTTIPTRSLPRRSSATFRRE